jgi:hypothetical protein
MLPTSGRETEAIVDLMVKRASYRWHIVVGKGYNIRGFSPFDSFDAHCGMSSLASFVNRSLSSPCLLSHRA